MSGLLHILDPDKAVDTTRKQTSRVSRSTQSATKRYFRCFLKKRTPSIVSSSYNIEDVDFCLCACPPCSAIFHLSSPHSQCFGIQILYMPFGTPTRGICGSNDVLHAQMFLDVASFHT